MAHWKCFIGFLVIFGVLPGFGEANTCYSCSGMCHNEDCNCQMGQCSAKQCFIEKKPSDIPGIMKITKGCLRRTPRIHHGCEYDHFSDHILCTCEGPYCNNRIIMNSTKHRHSVECRNCPEKNPDCGQTCRGNWCHEDLLTGAAGCGHGPPALPFFYRGPTIFYYRSRVCVILSRGAGKPRRHCICQQNRCNSVYLSNQNSYNSDREKSIATRNIAMSISEPGLPLHVCVSCETTAQEQLPRTTNCQTNRCLGHFCTYAANRNWGGSGRLNMVQSLTELQGCMNVTDSQYVLKGCSRKWMPDVSEEVHCACVGDLCNSDSVTAVSSPKSINTVIFQTLIAFLLIFYV
ncbi:unnamed protein product [Caenorhabditis angaria]|uniref:Uncharacterized protein n=1 Tax=Caenorhabditis angaria TaxID=860376 RepID=A0A9P1N9J7_9PELO|nr:unnamed protein product [Caenorhabditis angaria]